MSSILHFFRKLKKLIRDNSDWNKRYSIYIKQLAIFKKDLVEDINIIELPCLSDATSNTTIEPHYTYHPAWAARVLAQVKPLKHIDISSITHFSTIVSAFIPTEFYDYRPANIILSNYSAGKTDLTKLQFADNSIESLSCMHTVEHIGLGRYGDPINVNGDKKAMAELERVLAIGGSLLFVVPIGNSRIEFNAHRVYNYQQVMDNFPSLTLKEFSIIPDEYEKTGYIINPSEEIISSQHWACGCFWFTK